MILKNDEELYGWIELKLKEFKVDAISNSIYAFTIDNKQIASWYLYYLKEIGKADEEIHAIFCETFKEISKNEDIDVWFGFDLGKHSPFELFYAIVRYVHIREYDSFAKKEPFFYSFISSKSYEDYSPLKNYGAINFNFVIGKPELGLKPFYSKHEIFLPEKDSMMEELENYCKFKQVIKRTLGLSVEFLKKDIIVQRALWCYDPKKSASIAFVELFGENKEFQEQYYKTFEEYYNLSPSFLPMKRIYYTYDNSSKNEKTNRIRRLRRMLEILSEI